MNGPPAMKSLGVLDEKELACATRRHDVLIGVILWRGMKTEEHSKR